MEAEFKQAAEEVQKLKTRPSNNDLLALYGLYKQGSEGDNNTGKQKICTLKKKKRNCLFVLQPSLGSLI